MHSVNEDLREIIRLVLSESPELLEIVANTAMSPAEMYNVDTTIRFGEGGIWGFLPIQAQKIFGKGGYLWNALKNLVSTPQGLVVLIGLIGYVFRDEAMDIGKKIKEKAEEKFPNTIAAIEKFKQAGGKSLPTAEKQVFVGLIFSEFEAEMFDWFDEMSPIQSANDMVTLLQKLEEIFGVTGMVERYEAFIGGQPTDLGAIPTVGASAVTSLSSLDAQAVTSVEGSTVYNPDDLSGSEIFEGFAKVVVPSVIGAVLLVAKKLVVNLLSLVDDDIGREFGEFINSLVPDEMVPVGEDQFDWSWLGLPSLVSSSP